MSDIFETCGKILSAYILERFRSSRFRLIAKGLISQYSFHPLQRQIVLTMLLIGEARKTESSRMQSNY
jgi:hypothetical protein